MPRAYGTLNPGLSQSYKNLSIQINISSALAYLNLKSHYRIDCYHIDSHVVDDVGQVENAILNQT